MAVHIRLTRVGATRRPAYRVVAIDSRRSRDGRALEILGSYDPLTDPITVRLDQERIAAWIANGARPSAAVQRLMRAATAETAPAEKPRRAARTTKAKAEPKEPAEPKAAAEPTPAEAASEAASDTEAETKTEAEAS